MKWVRIGTIAIIFFGLTVGTPVAFERTESPSPSSRECKEDTSTDTFMQGWSRGGIFVCGVIVGGIVCG